MQESWVRSLGREDPPGEGNGNPLQYSCLENPMERRSLVCYSPWGRKESDTTEQLHFLFTFFWVRKSWGVSWEQSEWEQVVQKNRGLGDPGGAAQRRIWSRMWPWIWVAEVEWRNFTAVNSRHSKTKFWRLIYIRTFMLPKRMLGIGGERNLLMSQVSESGRRMTVLKKGRGWKSQWHQHQRKL